MAYEGDKPGFRALDELEEILGLVTDELASWRARALKAEQDLQALVSASPDAAGLSPGAVSARLAELESENADLRGRVDRAKQRVTELVQRVGFLEQQTFQGMGGAK